ncbi:MAG: hypothetical protein JW874_07625 [Spirochaetales bacterium]|nr:hypothetical protein [Spirochaetales bacterium]
MLVSAVAAQETGPGAQTDAGGQSDVYVNPGAGFSFSYPADLKVYESWPKDLTTPDDLFVFVFAEKLPVRAELNLGYDHLNIAKVREGLKEGKLDGMPFYYKSLSSLVKVKGGWAIENFALSWYNADNILFESRILFFSGDYIVSVWISAEAFRGEIISHYLGGFFEEQAGYYFWKHKKNANVLAEMMNLIKAGDIPVFEKWMNIANTINSSLQISQPKE